MICSRDDIKQLGTILGIWAHPDDETFVMGGIMAAAVQNGQHVVCITATRGEKGVQDEQRWPAARLADIRTQELMAAMKVLGVHDIGWLNYPDGGCKTVGDDKAVEDIMYCIEKYRPDSILTFGKDGLTGHDDHKAVAQWTKLAAKKCGSPAKVYTLIQTEEQYKAMRKIDRKFSIYFNINKPDTCDPADCAVCFTLDDDCYQLKLKALKAMPSQYEAMMKAYGGSMRPSLGVEAFIEASNDAK